MERVAFLRGNERTFAMVNPDELTFERQAGLRPRQYNERPLAAVRRSDDPLIYVGGGITDLKLNLLFDVELQARSTPSFSQPPDVRMNLPAVPTEGRAPVPTPPDETSIEGVAVASTPPGSPLAITDVRDLSGPLWRLAENGEVDALTGGPPVVYFIWGAAWHVPCIALSIAERFDRFSPDGTPLRSWVRIHLRRTHMPARSTRAPDLSITSRRSDAAPRTDASLPESVVLTDPTSSSRPDLICDSVYGDLDLMHALLAFNNIDDFWSLEPGQVLTTPPPSVLRESGGE
jgi:Contractile injection system tube protein